MTINFDTGINLGNDPLVLNGKNRPVSEDKSKDRPKSDSLEWKVKTFFQCMMKEIKIGFPTKDKSRNNTNIIRGMGLSAAGMAALMSTIKIIGLLILSPGCIGPISIGFLVGVSVVGVVGIATYLTSVSISAYKEYSKIRESLQAREAENWNPIKV